MADVAGVAVTLYVRRPLELCRVCMAGAYMPGLELLELLLCAELVGLMRVDC